MESERWEMGRDKRRLKFLESWHIDEYESWFSDMARKGWYLKRVGTLVVRFTKGEPKPTRYRIAAAGSPRRPGQAGSGWNDVCPFDNSGSLSVWACAEGPDTPEFPIVPERNIFALRHFHTEYLALALLTAASAFLLAGAFLFLMLADGTPFLSFLQSDLFPPFFALILFCFAGYALRGTTAIRALGKNPSPRPLARRGASWRKKRFLTKIAYLLPLLMLIALAAVSLTPPSFAGETRTLPADSGGLPLVRLSEIEQSPRLERKSEDTEGRAYDIRNYYSRHRTPLSLCWYESLETGIVDSSSSPDGRIFPFYPHGDVSSDVPLHGRKNRVGTAP